jgi:hypothetical protein
LLVARSRPPDCFANLRSTEHSKNFHQFSLTIGPDKDMGDPLQRKGGRVRLLRIFAHPFAVCSRPRKETKERAARKPPLSIAPLGVEKPFPFAFQGVTGHPNQVKIEIVHRHLPMTVECVRAESVQVVSRAGSSAG